MRKTPWTKTEEEHVKALLIEGKKYIEVAHALKRTRASVQFKIQEMQADPKFKEFLDKKHVKIFGTKDVVSWVPPLLNPLRINGDRFLTGDWHIDLHWPELVQRLIDEQKTKRRRGEKCGLVIAGDFLNGDCYSSYPKDDKTASSIEEFDAAEVMIDQLLVHFEKIEMCLGNHDARLLLHMAKSDSTGHLPFERVARMFWPEINKGRVQVGNFYWMTLNDKWRITHPKNYSQISGATGKKLATKFQQNISVAHEHHLGWCKDVGNRYQVVNQGCMIDPNRAAYIYERDSTSPEWNPGFICIQDSIRQVTLFDGTNGYKAVVR